MTFCNHLIWLIKGEGCLERAKALTKIPYINLVVSLKSRKRKGTTTNLQVQKRPDSLLSKLGKLAQNQEGGLEIRTSGFWCSFRPLLHHTSSAHNSHSAPEPLSLSNCIKLWGKLVLVQYDANIWC